MVDRQDIDALLIGALYGELTPAEEARLQTHLESHPADRSALDGLKSARSAVRESRIFDVQADPPQSVSALLLQEAHRRVPRKAADAGKEGWFARFARSFIMHPAMAAAATLVLVIGVAGTLYLTKGPDAQFAQQTKDDEGPPPAATPAIAAAPQGQGSAAGSAATPESADGEAQTAAVVEDKKAEAKPAETKPVDVPKTAAPDAYHTGLAEKGDLKAAPTAPMAKHTSKKAPTKDGIYVQRPEPTPKDFERGRTETLDEGALSDRDQGAAGGGASAGKPGRASNIGMSGSTAPVAQSPSPPPPPAAAQPPAPRKNAQAPSGGDDDAGAATTTSKRDSAKGGEDVSWAQARLDQAVSLVSASDCEGAYRLVTEIRARAPMFYRDHVESARELKGCSSYFQNANVRAEDRSRAKAKMPAPTAAPADKAEKTK